MQIVTIITTHRPAEIEKHLTGIPHEVFINPDLPAPPDQPYDCLSFNALGAYRCWSGHKEAARRLQGQPGLILEDDSAPCCSEWLKVANDAMGLLDEYEIVSLHCRTVPEDVYGSFYWKHDRQLVTLCERPRLTYRKQWHTYKWGMGSLAYLVSAEAGKRLAEGTWDGFPQDLLICNRFTFAAIAPSPFEHIKGNSLVINAKEVKPLKTITYPLFSYRGRSRRKR